MGSRVCRPLSFARIDIDAGSSSSSITHIGESELTKFQKSLRGKKLLFAKGFGQNDWGSIDNFDGFLVHNDQKMLDEIQRTVRSYGLSAEDYVVIDGDPVKAGFQVFVRWIVKETGCQLIWAKKLPARALPEAKQREGITKMLADVDKWRTELQPFNTRIYFVEISQERQDQEMLKIFGNGLLSDAERPKYNAPVMFSDHDGELQHRMKKGVRQHETVQAYAAEVEGYSQKGPMEFCAFENAAKGLVIRSVLRPHAERTLTLLTGGGQASVLEVAACAVLDEVDPDTELAVFPASRGKPDKDPKMVEVAPHLQSSFVSCISPSSL